jgi:pimeloyl-ACP methyl ester carboxylesterase
MATFLLVHGAWHGGWCWRRVVPHLRASGHEVFTPTLTGLGERAHLLVPEVGLDTHVKDVLGVIEYEDLNEVVLVGHSYAGMVITSVAEAAPDRLAHLVYLDAWVPTDGQATFDLMPSETRDSLREAARVSGGGVSMPPIFPLEVFGITDEADARWVGSKLVSHPLKSYEDPAKLASGAARRLPRTYISCTGNPALGAVFRPYAEQARTDEGWRHRELATGHDAMVTMPRELSNLLVEVV